VPKRSSSSTPSRSVCNIRWSISFASAETIIIEHAESIPSVLGFSIGHEVRDIIGAVVDQRGVPKPHAAAVLHPLEEKFFKAMRFDPLASPTDLIKVRIHWRTATRRRFSRGRAQCKISVRDYQDREHETERNRNRRV
jgi:hypothetical protein